MILSGRNYLVYGRGVTRVSRKSLFLGVYIYYIFPIVNEPLHKETLRKYPPPYLPYPPLEGQVGGGIDLIQGKYESIVAASYMLLFDSFSI